MEKGKWVGSEAYILVYSSGDHMTSPYLSLLETNTIQLHVLVSSYDRTSIIQWNRTYCKNRKIFGGVWVAFTLHMLHFLWFVICASLKQSEKIFHIYRAKNFIHNQPCMTWLQNPCTIRRTLSISKWKPASKYTHMRIFIAVLSNYLKLWPIYLLLPWADGLETIER